MPPYKAKLKAQKTLCAGTTAFYFEKPEEFQIPAGTVLQFHSFETGRDGSGR